MINSTSQETTSFVKISVVSESLNRESDPQKNIYAFKYTITIENLRDDVIQLIERHWIINSAGKKIGEVVGPGVVGVQHIFKPGEIFKYTSGTYIQDPVGSMEGTYKFKTLDTIFKVQIPKFNLIFPLSVH